ncbi:DUF721 domain-containing protein [Candidatus Kuenenia sp.]|uniref:DUF721 domain-containing protein n=1 Tax=Candidatus Kuenenia sp. TaxID=2499824 RepID=UPI00321FC4C0
MKDELRDRYFINKNKPKQIGDLLKELFPPKTLSRTNSLHNNISNAWRNIVGDEIYQITRIDGLKNRILYINVESSALIHHLTNFERHAIIQKINELMGKKSIDDIRFKVGNIK